jgi:tellurite resistance protein
MTDHHNALIYIMVLVSAADADMTDSELNTIGENVRYLPVFRDFSVSRLPQITEDCLRILADPDGLNKALSMIRNALPPRLRETAYAVACDIAASDKRASREELRLLEMLRDKLDLDLLVAAAIERGARARHATL